MDMIRLFREEDRAPLQAILNLEKPLHRQHTPAEWKRQDERRSPDEVYLRLVVGEPVIGYMEAIDMNTSPWRMENVCYFYLHVAPEERCKGIGSALYERVLDFARERNSSRLLTGFMEHDAGTRFLEQRGFIEQERNRGSYLDLNGFDAGRFTGVVEQVEQGGVHIFAYADVPDTDENRHKFYHLEKRLANDIPRRDTQPLNFPPYEQWVKDNMGMPEWSPDATIFAEVNGNWIGLSQLMFNLETNVGYTNMTGVLAEYRGRNIATALKLRAFEAAQVRGCSTIITENHEDNGPMLAINRKFGFVPDMPYVMYSKMLNEKIATTGND